MPLVTRQSNQGFLWKESSTPNWTTNDLWVRTTDSAVFVNKSGTATQLTSKVEDITRY